MLLMEESEKSSMFLSALQRLTLRGKQSEKFKEREDVLQTGSKRFKGSPAAEKRQRDRRERHTGETQTTSSEESG